MNSYCPLGVLKAELRTAGTSDDAALLKILEAVSRGIDDWTRRHFYALVAQTRYFSWWGPCNGYITRDEIAAGAALWLDDMVSITSVATGYAATFDTALVENTDYYTWPFNRPANDPIRLLYLDPNLAGALAEWPRGPRKIKVIGTFGWSYETQSEGPLGAAITDAAATSITLTAGHSVSAGSTLLIDSEQIDVTAVSTNTATVVRGINGTTAATHLITAVVYQRRYPRPIEEACRLDAARVWREAQTGMSGGQAGANQLGSYSFSATYPAIRDLVGPYINRAAVL